MNKGTLVRHVHHHDRIGRITDVGGGTVRLFRMGDQWYKADELQQVSSPGYTPAREWTAEGARVGLVTCEMCGAAVLLDPGDKISATDRHTTWHFPLPTLDAAVAG